MEGFLQEKLCWWKLSTVDCASSQGKPGLELRQDCKEESKTPLLLHLYPGDMGGDFLFFPHSFYERMMTCFRLLKQPLISNGDRSLSAFMRQDLDLFSLPSRSASDFSKNNPPHHKSLLAIKSWVWMWQQTVGEPSCSKIDPNSQLVPTTQRGRCRNRSRIKRHFLCLLSHTPMTKHLEACLSHLPAHPALLGI